jgi:diguanylate cyclase (GGDEF)-like protein
MFGAWRRAVCAAHAGGRHLDVYARLALAFAAQAAIAIENARLYEQSRQELAERNQTQDRLRQANERLQAQLAEIEALQAQLREQAIRDPLTGLFNRRYLEETLGREVARAGRAGSAIGVILMDVDDFKTINDTFGHEAGDLMLQAIAQRLRLQTRRSDVVCRHGGEEFLAVLPGASVEITRQRAEQMRQALQALRVPHGDDELRTTLSFGVAAFPRHGQTAEDVLRSADQALYLAKAQGRNRVVVWAANQSA